MGSGNLYMQYCLCIICQKAAPTRGKNNPKIGHLLYQLGLRFGHFVTPVSQEIKGLSDVYNGVGLSRGAGQEIINIVNKRSPLKS